MLFLELSGVQLSFVCSGNCHCLDLQTKSIRNKYKFDPFANLIFLSIGQNILINQGFHKCAKNGQHHSRQQKMIHFDIEISHRCSSSIHLEEQTHQKCCGDSTNAKLCCIPGKVRTWVTYVSSGACPVSSDCCLHHPTSESDRAQARNLPETMLWKIIHSKYFSVSDWLKSHA